MGRHKTPMGIVFDIVGNKMGVSVSSRNRKRLKEYLMKVKPPYYTIDAMDLLNKGKYDEIAELCISTIIRWDEDNLF